MHYNDYTQSELDAQFNLRSAIPEFQRYFDNWERRSARVRSHFPSWLDVAYGDKNAEKP